MRNMILTTDLRLVCALNGKLAFVALEDFENSGADPVSLVRYEDHWRLEIKKNNKTSWCDLETLSFERPVSTVSLKVDFYTAFSETPPALFICWQKKNLPLFLSTDESLKNCWSETQGEQSIFYLIETKILKLLLKLKSLPWVLGPEAKEISFKFDKESPLPVHFGPYPFELPAFLKILQNATPEDELIFLAQGQIYRAVPFNPVVLYCIFGQRVLEEFEIAIKSLVEFGKYTGKLVLFTDLAKSALLHLIPEKLKAKTEILKGVAKNRDDFISAKQFISTCGHLAENAPILYLDCDVIVDKPVFPTLRKAALARFPDAQKEPFAGVFTRSIGNGGDLFGRDPFLIKNTYGFNAGVITFPRLEERKRLGLLAAYQTNLLYNETFGKGSLNFTEQSVMNYALFKLQFFQYGFLSSKIAVGGLPSSEHVSIYGGNDPNQRRGFIHFWCSPSGPDRRGIMYNYARQLKEILDRKPASKKGSQKTAL